MTDRESALTHLHTRLHDSVDGYQAALERTESPMLKDTIHEMLAIRRTAVAEVHKVLAGMGVEVSHDGSTLADAHRAFLKLKDSVTGAGDEAVLAEIARGEQSLVSAYDDAIEAAGPSDPETMWLTRQRADVQAKVDAFEARAKAA